MRWELGLAADARAGACCDRGVRRAVFVTLAAADTILAATGRDRRRWLTKPLLMPVLIAGRDPAVQRALALGWAGDVALLGTGDAAFRAGLGCFLVGHLAWISALRRRGGGRLSARPTLVVPPLATATAVTAWLWPRTGSDRVPVLIYSATLTAMSLTALDRGSPAAAAGGVLFLASDCLLALRKFGGMRLPGGEGLVMATYATAQALLAQAAAPPASATADRPGNRAVALSIGAGLAQVRGAAVPLWCVRFWAGRTG